jgi:hypothetical protein
MVWRQITAVVGIKKWAVRAANLIIGQAAYETARRMYPNDRVDYRDGARIIATSGPEPKGPA